jgi:hypothetical protein
VEDQGHPVRLQSLRNEQNCVIVHLGSIHLGKKTSEGFEGGKITISPGSDAIWRYLKHCDEGATI